MITVKHWPNSRATIECPCVWQHGEQIFGECDTICRDVPIGYLKGKPDYPPNYPVPALPYYYSYDAEHFDLQYVMLCSDAFADAVIAYNKGATR